MSLSEIAAELGLKGSERVRQIEAQALGKLKVELERRGYQMSDFLEMVDDNSAWNRRHTKSHI
jgi:DNA-directed RNA polymerase sigma subunit (sigma70/sigma32)